MDRVRARRLVAAPALRRLARESLSAQAETFRTALRLDLIGADDFR
jgi:hypothetical protein